MEEYEFQILINPSNLFTSVEEITSFISLTDNIIELGAFLNELIKEELYEYCQIVQAKIDYLNER